jgi:hypothetical protein
VPVILIAIGMLSTLLCLQEVAELVARRIATTRQSNRSSMALRGEFPLPRSEFAPALGVTRSLAPSSFARYALRELGKGLVEMYQAEGDALFWVCFVAVVVCDSGAVLRCVVSCCLFRKRLFEQTRVLQLTCKQPCVRIV